jgi:hypothetical protein
MKISFVRILGSLGIGGALLMFIGDMCLYGHLGSGGDFWKNLPLVISNESDIQIVAGGFIGPIAALLYCLGFFSIYEMISPKSPILAIIVAGGAAAMIVIGAAYHAMWGIRALLIKAGLPSGDYHELYNEIKQYTLLFYDAAGVVGGIASVLLLFVVLSRRSLYPRWTAVVNPGFLFLFSPLAGFIPAPLGAIVYGGYFNLVFVVFFSVTVFSTRSNNHADQMHGT